MMNQDKSHFQKENNVKNQNRKSNINIKIKLIHITLS